MKALLVSLTLFFAFEASATNVCYGRYDHCGLKSNLICANVEQVGVVTYRLNRLKHLTGCMSWGVSKFKSKNKICKNIMAKLGEKRKVSYLPGSAVKGVMETYLGTESNGQIDCVVEESK